METLSIIILVSLSIFPYSEQHADVAAGIQNMTEDILLRLVRDLGRESGLLTKPDGYGYFVT